MQKCLILHNRIFESWDKSNKSPFLGGFIAFFFTFESYETQEILDTLARDVWYTWILTPQSFAACVFIKSVSLDAFLVGGPVSRCGCLCLRWPALGLSPCWCCHHHGEARQVGEDAVLMNFRVPSIPSMEIQSPKLIFARAKIHYVSEECDRHREHHEKCSAIGQEVFLKGISFAKQSLLGFHQCRWLYDDYYPNHSPPT